MRVTLSKLIEVETMNGVPFEQLAPEYVAEFHFFETGGNNPYPPMTDMHMRYERKIYQLKRESNENVKSKEAITA